MKGIPVLGDKIPPDAAVESTDPSPPDPPDAANPDENAVPSMVTIVETTEVGAAEPPEIAPDAANPELKAVCPDVAKTEGAGVCKAPEPAPPLEPPVWPPLEKTVKVEKTDVDVTPAPVIFPAPFDVMPPEPLPPLPPPEPPVAME